MAKYTYHSRNFYMKTDGAKMILWTIIDKKVYCERGIGKHTEKMSMLEFEHILDWHKVFQMMLKDPSFPDKIQFWTVLE